MIKKRKIGKTETAHGGLLTILKNSSIQRKYQNKENF